MLRERDLKNMFSRLISFQFKKVHIANSEEVSIPFSFQIRPGEKYAKDND